ncbi:hypothetical protein PYCCODRAFT_1296963 [Trametes coccinea BRFM310]|uniref:Uncharacterized protein n=1 Tax=Trametes coccinea (strain BRFM310) TaxID=1353009 RepID=A0A1Y2IX67_TRAC3|nr:hypothetical protein PYCCODRAFT_1296963 [Trametes coccinea BRFM310]
MPPYPPPLSLLLSSHRLGILLPLVWRPMRWSLHYFLGIIIPSTLSSTPRISITWRHLGSGFSGLYSRLPPSAFPPVYRPHRSGHPRTFLYLNIDTLPIAGSAVGAGIHTPSSVAPGLSSVTSVSDETTALPILPCIFYLDSTRLASRSISLCHYNIKCMLSHLVLHRISPLLSPPPPPICSTRTAADIHRRTPGVVQQAYRRARKRIHQEHCSKTSAIWSAGGPPSYLYLLISPGSQRVDDLQWVSRPGASNISSLLGWHRSPASSWVFGTFLLVVFILFTSGIVL